MSSEQEVQTYKLTWSAGVHQLCSALISLVSLCFLSFSVLHTYNDGECGSLMTHPLHTSLLLDHIWAARKSMFSELVLREAGTAGTLPQALFCFIFPFALFVRVGTSNLGTDVSLLGKRQICLQSHMASLVGFQ